MLRTILCAAFAASAFAAQAQSWPNKPVTFLNPFPAGGGTDTFARPIAARLLETLGQQVIVENQGGAGGTVGATNASKRAPDGYNWFFDACDCSDNLLVLPYMGYARQDKRFKKGEPISARAIAKTLSNGIREIITVNIHEQEVMNYFGVPARNISLARDIGFYIKTLHLDNPLILAPDEGALTFAEHVASAGGWDFDHLEKIRLSGVKVQMKPKQLCAASRSVVIVDDIISTGGTIATAAGLLCKQGAKEVFAACVHGVLSEGAYVHLRAAGIREVICSDKIERGCSKITAADQIAHAIKKG